MCDLGPAISTPIRIFICRAWRLNHRQWMVMMDNFCRLVLPGFFRIGVNGRPHFGRQPVVTLRVSYRPFEDLMVRVPHHDPEHGGSILLTTLSLSMGRRVRAGLRVSLSRTLSASNRFAVQTALEPHLMLANDGFLDGLMSDRGPHSGLSLKRRVEV